MSARSFLTYLTEIGTCLVLFALIGMSFGFLEATGILDSIPSSKGHVRSHHSTGTTAESYFSMLSQSSLYGLAFGAAVGIAVGIRSAFKHNRAERERGEK
jgi:hypothetical protein